MVIAGNEPIKEHSFFLCYTTDCSFSHTSRQIIIITSHSEHITVENARKNGSPDAHYYLSCDSFSPKDFSPVSCVNRPISLSNAFRKTQFALLPTAPGPLRQKKLLNTRWCAGESCYNLGIRSGSPFFDFRLIAAGIYFQSTRN